MNSSTKNYFFFFITTLIILSLVNTKVTAASGTNKNIFTFNITLNLTRLVHNIKNLTVMCSIGKKLSSEKGGIKGHAQIVDSSIGFGEKTVKVSTLGNVTTTVSIKVISSPYQLQLFSNNPAQRNYLCRVTTLYSGKYYTLYKKVGRSISNANMINEVTSGTSFTYGSKQRIGILGTIPL